MYERQTSSLTPEDEAGQETTLRPFAERLRAVRKIVGLSQDELDGRCCPHGWMVFKLESGRKVPGLFIFLWPQVGSL
jgi:hypothetical protein